MVGITDRLDPDWWIAEGRALTDYPVLEPSSPYAGLIDVVLADKRELATHLGRWMARVAETRIAQAGNRVHSPLTEENLRSLWEETRSNDATFSMPDDSATEEGIAFTVAEAPARQAPG